MSDTVLVGSEKPAVVLPLFIQCAIVFVLILSSFMELFDTTIVNVALPTMMGAFSVDYQQISWVVTSYVIGAALFMPLTGFFIKILGHKKLLLISLSGFLCFSILCGLARTLPEISIFRLLQGMCGANLLALSQYIIALMFTGAAYQRALACWGMSGILAPITAVIVGGYVIGKLSWPVIFFMNVPVCLIALYGCMIFISETKKVEKLKLSWFGVALMFFSVGSIQLILDRGDSWGWFTSIWVCLLLYGAVIALIFFIRLGIKEKSFFVNIRLFNKKQFALSFINMFLFSSTLLAGSILYSLVLQTVYGVSAENVGLLYIPDAIAAIVGLGLILPLMKYVDLRLLILSGVVISLMGNGFMMFLSSHLSLSQIVWAEVFTSFGKIFFLLPVLIISPDGLNKDETADAASFINFGRNIGASFGASGTVIFLTHCTNVGWASLHAFASPLATGYAFWKSTQELFSSPNLYNPLVNSIVSNQISHQATLMSFNASFACIEVLYLLCIIPVLFLSAPKSINLAAME